MTRHPGVAPDVAELLDRHSAVIGARPGSNPVPIDQARQQHENDVLRFSPRETRDAVESVSDVELPAPRGTVSARLYRPAGASHAVMVWIHGGGWVTGSIDTGDVVARALCARCDLTVVSVSYGLAPEHPWPSGLEDVRAAVAWVRENVADAAPLLIGGDSAGGNLAAVIAGELGRDVVAGQVLVYPVIALDEPQDAYPSRVENGTGYYVQWDDVAWAIDKYVGEPDRGDPGVSPIRGVAAGRPPAVIAVAGFDPLRDEAVAFAEWLDAGGVAVDLLEFPGLVHGAFDMIGGSSTADEAMTALASAVTRRLIP
ncbi:MAG: hypothetical protein BGO97_07745 [Micrococcales bacterium 70-64]|nr:alpha/beta hydrolase [Leifsonia sp.]ODU63936.1 MAG: hypothetical protein ABT06_07750 [Leifsonia sp. SCN 70-46]OJX85627.1 MAG: hypothetical protein BGO97_07745 [Micrococcales bacterium 70-64]